jgi:hypothetical protein
MPLSLGAVWSARSFIAAVTDKATVYETRCDPGGVDHRLDTLTSLPGCEQTAGRDPATVTTALTTRLKSYDDALLAFRTAQAALNKPDSTKAVSQQ